MDKNGYVAKILKEKLNDGYKEIYKILRKEDPNEDRFALYHVIQRNKCTIPSIDITNCENVLFSPLDTETVLVTKKLVDIPDITKLTAQQYRYLRESLKILRKLQVHHGDLLDNVMLSPKSNLPIINDWSKQSRIIHEDDLARDFDLRNFINNYKCVKKV